MNLFRRARIPRLALASLALLFLAAFSSLAGADNVVQGYYENGDLQPGWIVALSPKSSSTVEAAPAHDASRIYGVVINPSDVPLTLNQSGQQVYVATSGAFPVLVSVSNGKVAAGDYISMSGTDGIGAKAKDNQSTVLGRANQAFDGVHNVIAGSGSTAVGSISVNISPERNPAQKGRSSLPLPVVNAATTIAGHPVSTVRVWAAVATFLLACGIGIVLLVVGVRTGMTAIGRNPLSKHSILMGLMQVVGISVLIFIVGLFGVYLLLKL